MDRRSRVRLPRRDFLKMSAGAGLLAAGFHSGVWGSSRSPMVDGVVFARLQYMGGDWDTDTRGHGLTGGAEINLMRRVEANTTLPAWVGEFFIRANDPEIASYPFLYATGHSGIRFLDDEIASLRSVLASGSLLFAEDCFGDREFSREFRREIALVFPARSLKKIPMDHPLYRAPYRLSRIMGGDKLVHEYMEGIEIDGRLAVVYCDNDLGCAWEGHGCGPGGEEQREHAFRLGINLISYTLSGI